MKKPQDHLWQLIQALNPAEKRYFRRHFAPDEGQLISLYEALNKQTSYDESALREKLDCSPALFKVLKAQLLDLLLLSLRACYDKNSISAKISATIHEVDLLVDRSLYELALPRLQRTKELCLQYEEYGLLYEVIQREYILTQLYSESYQLSTADYWADWQLIADQLSLHLYFQREGQSLMDHQRNPTPASSAAYERMVQKLEQSPAPSHFRTRLSWLTTRQVLLSLKGEKRQAVALKKEAVDLFEQSPLFKDSYTVAYIGAMRNYANALTDQLHKPELEQVIRKTKEIITRHPAYEPHLLHFCFAKIRLDYALQHWKQVTDYWLKQIAPLSQKHHLQGSRIYGFSLTFVAMAYLNQGKYEAAIQWIADFDTAAPKVEPSGRMLATLINLILYWETEDQEKLRTKLSAIRRRKPGREPIPESGLFAIHLQLLEQLLRQPFEAARLAGVILLELPNYYNDPFFGLYTTLGLERWLQALATRRKIIDVLRERPFEKSL